MGRPGLAGPLRKQLEPLETTVRAALNAMDSMNEVLERVRRECGDDPA